MSEQSLNVVLGRFADLLLRFLGEKGVGNVALLLVCFLSRLVFYLLRLISKADSSQIFVNARSSLSESC
jgi:hypothetical protein